MMRILLLCVALATSILAPAENYSNLQPLHLQVPDMKPELAAPTPLTFDTPEKVTLPEIDSWKPDFDFFKSKTNVGVKPYKFMDDMSFAGVPLFIAGIAIKGDKAMFAQNNKNGKKNTQLLTDFKTGIDDYTQFFGPAMVVGLKLGGVEGRSDWPRLASSALASYAFMAAFVNGIKYTAKEMRPDGSTANSWPSGHTATSFVGATILHKEYGLTRSPWYSVAGYGVATATGVMRVLNNRHWVSDVMSGAGIGIISGELGYAICDLLFKEKGLLRNDMESNFEDPSFFSISMGVGLGSKSLEFSNNDLQDKEKYDPDLYDLSGDESESIQFRAATVVDAEGAYFLNKYVGVGGRLRVRAMSAKSFGKYADITSADANDAWEGMVGSMYYVANLIGTHPYLDMTAAKLNGAPITSMGGTVVSDHLTEFTVSGGLYFNIPLSQRFALGTKLLIGRSIMQEMDIDGYAEGYVKDINYNMTVTNSNLTSLVLQQPTGVKDAAGNYTKYTDKWDYITLGGENSTTYSTGLSLTYHYRSNFSWRLFCDYDYTRKTYTLKADPYHFLQKALSENAYSLLNNNMLSPYSDLLDQIVYKKEKKMHYFTLGLSFMVNI